MRPLHRVPRPVLALVLTLVIALSGCTAWPFGDDDEDAPGSPNGSTGGNGGDAGPRGNLTVAEAVDRATVRVRDQFGPDARLTRLNATVDANGTLRGDATLLYHVNGSATYPDAWQDAYADAGAFVTAIVPPRPDASVTLAPLEGPLPALQGVLFDAGTPASGSAAVALRAARGAVPVPAGAWRLAWEPLACPDAADGSPSWRVGNGTHAARVTADGASLCAGPARVDALLPQLIVIADVPHGTFVVQQGDRVTAPVEVDVRTITGGPLRFILALSGAGPEELGASAEERRPGELPEGWSARTDPGVVTVDARGLVRVNVTVDVPADAAPGTYRLITHPRSDAPRFSGGQDEPLKVLVRAAS